MTRGTIQKLTHLCSGTDDPVTHLVNAHNGVGDDLIHGRMAAGSER